MTRKLFYNVNHFIKFFPETIDWQHSRIRIVVDINTNIKTSPYLFGMLRSLTV